MMLSDCPKCGLSLPAPDSTCPKCGLIFAKWSAPRPFLGPYEYKMVQVAEHVVVRAEALKGNEGAAYLQAEVNEQAQQGWEFFRIDEMSLSVSRPELFGTRSQGPVTRFYVVTFRRPPKSQGTTAQPGV